MTSREEIETAFWELISSATGFANNSQRFRSWDQVNGPGNFPFLTMIPTGENRSRQDEGLPILRLFYSVLVYTMVGDPGAIPSTPLGLLLDRLDQAVKPVGSDLLNGNRQTLGNLVTHCYPLGHVAIDASGADGKVIAGVPFEIMLPWVV
jgi:hypothetical protein